MFLSDFPEPIRRTIESKFQLLRFKAGEWIIEEGAESTDVFFVLSGSVGISQFTVDGHELIFNVCQKDEMFGEFAAIDSMPRNASVRAFEACELARVRAADFLAILNKSPETNLRLMRYLVRLIRALNQRLRRRAGVNAFVRVYGYIAEKAIKAPAPQKQKGEIFIALPKQAVLAPLLDVSRETVARALGRLAKEKIIRKERSGLILVDAARLAALIGDQ